jgi:hypothetical protein
MVNKNSLQKTVLSILLTLTIFLLTDYFAGKSILQSGVITGRHFRSKKTYLKKQRKTDSQGHSYTKNVRKKRPENWYLIVKSDAGEKIKIECEKEAYRTFETGQRIQYKIKEGFFTKFIYQEKITLAD